MIFSSLLLARRIFREALDMERIHEEGGVEGKCRKDKIMFCGIGLGFL